MILNKVSDFKDILVNQTIQNLVKNFGFKFIAVFDLQNQNLMGFYQVNNFLVQDEQNRKTFFIKGKSINLAEIVQKPNWQYDIKEKIEQLLDCEVIYSENMFGFIGYGLNSY